MEFPEGTTFGQFIHRISEHFHISESEVALSFDDGGRRKVNGSPDEPLSNVLRTEMC
jgi:hypothetical protein